MVLIEFFLIAVAIFVAILCLKHDLDKKREKLLDEMTKKTTEKMPIKKENPQFRNPTNSLRSLRSTPPRMRFLLFKLAFCHILTDMSA